MNRLLCCAFAMAALAAVAHADEAPAKPKRELPTSVGRYTGDLDVVLEHRLLRVLVPMGRTIYFHDRGAQRGVIADAMHEVEKELNRKYRDKRPLVVALIPTTRDKLIPGLIAGDGDVAAGDITVTEARAKLVDFTSPTLQNVGEIIVTGPNAPPLASLEDLAGKEIHVRPSTSYYESVVALNERFAREGKPPVVMRPLPDALEDEDKLDMVNAGLIPIAIVDDWIAEIWEKSLPNVTLRRDLVLRSDGQVAWAVRKNSPKLRAALDDLIARSKKQSTAEVILGRNARAAKQLHNATSKRELAKFQATIELFRKYGDQYGFDHLMLAAQGYQESRLNQNAKSRAGAIGVMQIMPKTGKELGVGDIRKLEPNVHGGARYLARLIDRYFKDANFDEQNRTLFAFASYNAGPANVAKLRATAQAEGLEPDVWFNSVEHVAARKIGREPVAYVRNIYKYYVAYKLALEAQAERAQAIQQAGGPAPK